MKDICAECNKLNGIFDTLGNDYFFGNNKFGVSFLICKDCVDITNLKIVR